jgi:acyl carrier protein
MKIELFISSFEELFEELENGPITPETEFKELSGWDSLMALSVIAIVDELYGLKLNGDDIRQSNTIDELFSLVSQKSLK